jgi:hypothetical protein
VADIKSESPAGLPRNSQLAAKARKALEQKQPTLAELMAASPRMTRAEIEALEK